MSKSTERIALVRIGWGGWTAYPLPDPAWPHYSSEISGYGTGWRDYLSHMDDDAPVVNLRALSQDDERLYALAISGPMVALRVPEGMVDGLGDLRPFDPRPVIGRPLNAALLGNAHALDYVGPRTYAMIADKMGAKVTTAAEELHAAASA